MAGSSLAFAAGLPIAVYWLKKPRVNQTSDKSWIYWVSSPGMFSKFATPVLKVINIASKPQYLAVRAVLHGADPAAFRIVGQASSESIPAASGVAEIRSSVAIKPRQQIDVSLPPGTTIQELTVASFKNMRD